MVADGVVFRFSADIRDLTVKIDQMSKKLEQLGVKSKSAQAGVAGVGAGANVAGQQAISASVKFQTMTQGMLNLSTATVQTITSLSNLDRVQNRAKQAAIAVARAEDLLANKQERLNKLRESGTASQEKVLNIQREIITATEDITVKQEKLKIEQGAVNDIYALFFTNIANVGISSLQTIASLYQLMTIKTVANSAAMTANTGATELNTQATTRQMITRRLTSPVILGNTIQTKINTAAQISNTIASKAAVGALTALKIALGPIGLILIGVSAAMAAYEVATGGISNAMGFAQKESKEFASELDAQRKALDDLTGSSDKYSDTLALKVSPSVAENIKQFRELTKAIKGATTSVLIHDIAIQGLAAKANGTTQQTKGLNFSNFNLTGTDFRNPGTQAGGAKGVLKPGLPGFINFLFIRKLGRTPISRNGTNQELPTALGPPSPNEATQFKYSPFYNVFEKEFINNRINQGVPASMAIQQLEDEKIRSLAALSGNVALAEAIARLSPSEAFVRSFGIGGTQFLQGATKQPSLEDEARDQRISVDRLIRNLKIEGRTRQLDKRVLGQGFIQNGVAIGGDLEFRAKFFAASNRDPDRPTAGRRELNERIRIIQSIPPHIKRKIRSGEIFGNRLEVIIEKGIDIGNVANAISMNEALRIATLEHQLGLSGFATNEERNQSIANAIAFNGQAFITKAQINDQRSRISALLGNVADVAGAEAGNRSTNFFGAGFFKSTGATAAFQVADVATPQHILIRARQRDAYAKSLQSVKDGLFYGLVAGTGIRLNRSQVRHVNNAGRGNHQAGIEALFAPLRFISDALNAVTSTGVSQLTRPELGEIGYDFSAIKAHIENIGKPRYDEELRRIRLHKEDIERYNERLVAMSSGVGGF